MYTYNSFPFSVYIFLSPFGRGLLSLRPLRSPHSAFPSMPKLRLSRLPKVDVGSTYFPYICRDFPRRAHRTHALIISTWTIDPRRKSIQLPIRCKLGASAIPWAIYFSMKPYQCPWFFKPCEPYNYLCTSIFRQALGANISKK